MVLPRSINCLGFSTKVLQFVLNELEFFREKSGDGEGPQVSKNSQLNFSKFYECIGKAATMFALMNRAKVRTSVIQNENKFSKTSTRLHEFIQVFANLYFRRVEPLPQKWFPVVILMFCGVVGAVADVLKEFNRQDLLETCRKNLEMQMRTSLEEISDTGGWANMYNAASVFAALYDFKNWKNDTTENQGALEAAIKVATDEVTEEAKAEAELKKAIEKATKELMIEATKGATMEAAASTSAAGATMEAAAGTSAAEAIEVDPEEFKEFTEEAIEEATREFIKRVAKAARESNAGIEAIEEANNEFIKEATKAAKEANAGIEAIEEANKKLIIKATVGEEATKEAIEATVGEEATKEAIEVATKEVTEEAAESKEATKETTNGAIEEAAAGKGTD